MLFNSLDFAIFFPVFFVLYWIVAKRLTLRNVLILGASYLFYGWWDWRFLFLIGLIGGVGVYRLAGGSLQEISIISSLPVLIGAGLLTGIGTDMGSGCTSGHGICGLARLSMRSIAATGTFVFIAVATFFFTRHIVGG